MNSNLKIDLDSLRVISAIVRQGSFSGAAQALHRVPSTISYTVSKVEKNLNIQVFERAGHQISLTKEGEELYLRGEELLRLAYETESALKNLSIGWESELRISVHDFFPAEKTMALVGELQQVAPYTRVRVSEEVLAGLWDALLADRTDFVVAIGPEGAEMSNLSYCKGGEVEFVFAVARDHPLANAREPLSDDEIRRHQVVAIADTSQELPTQSVGILAGQPVLTVSTPQMKLQAHLQGLGVGTIPKAMIQPWLDNGSLIIKQTEAGSNWRAPVVYAWKRKRRGKALQWLIDRVSDSQRPIDWF